MKERLQKMLGEQTLVLIKPDAVMRGLVGIIFQRFEQAGLKIMACKILFPTRKLLDGHFPKSEDWVRGMGEKTLETYREYQIDPVEILGTADALVIGQKIKEWNYRYLTLGPVMAMVLEGIHAVDTVRKLIGYTLPYKASPGTIRGDFSINAPDLANVVGSACKNLVHASGTIEEAEQEIANWFNSNELVAWRRTDDFVHFVQGEFTETQTGKEGDVMQYAALEKTLNSLREVDPRNAAEYAYVLAQLHKRAGNDDQAIQFGRDPSPSSTSVEWIRWRNAPRVTWSWRVWRFPISSIRMWCGIGYSRSSSNDSLRKATSTALSGLTTGQGFFIYKRKTAPFSLERCGSIGNTLL